MSSDEEKQRSTILTVFLVAVAAGFVGLIIGATLGEQRSVMPALAPPGQKARDLIVVMNKNEQMVPRDWLCTDWSHTKCAELTAAAELREVNGTRSFKFCTEDDCSKLENVKMILGTASLVVSGRGRVLFSLTCTSNSEKGTELRLLDDWSVRMQCDTEFHYLRLTK